MERRSPGRRATVGVVLLWVAAVGALAAAAGSVPTLAEADGDVLVAEWWRVIGLVAFAGLFALLARRPGSHVAVWAVVGLNKLLLGVVGSVLLLTADGDAPEGAVALAVGDGLLAVLLGISFLLVGPSPRETPVPVRTA